MPFPRGYMENKEVWISVLIVVVLLALGVFLTQKTTWFESSYNSSDYAEFGDGDFVGFPDENVASAPYTAECASDGDCVADSCCHATACVSRDKLPDCSGTKCTQACIPGTLDCGQASCSCMEGKCSVLNNP